MVPMQVILHPTDFSEASRPAYRLAINLAHAHGARVVVLHVLEPGGVPYGEFVTEPEEQEPMEECAEAFRHLTPPPLGVPVEHRAERGNPVEVILRVADEVKSEQIVLGTHGRSGFSRLLMGSVAEEVLRKAKRGVVVVKGPRVCETRG